MIPRELAWARDCLVAADDLHESREHCAEWVAGYDVAECRAFLEGFKSCSAALEFMGGDISVFAPIFIALEEEIEKREVAA